MIEEINNAPNPQTEYLNGTKVARFISTNQGLISDEEEISMQLITLPKKNVFVTVNLYADENLTLSNPNITQYDLAVMDAAYTLYVSGYPSFSTEMIARVMSGNMDQNVTPQKAGAVTRALNKLKSIRIRIDCTEEMIARKKIKKGQTAHLESYLMPLEEVELKLGNQKIVKGYQLLKEPVLYSYAERIGQIINVPRSLLETKGTINDTDEVVILKRYLIKRIEAMKNEKNNVASRRISYEWYDKNTKSSKGMLSELGYRQEDFNNWREKKSKIHKMVKTILNAFTAEKYIKSFSEVIEGRRLNGIDITI